MMCVCLLGCSNRQTSDINPDELLSDVEINHAIHNGNEANDNGSLCDAVFSAALLEKRTTIESESNLYQMLLVADIEHGFYPDFEAMTICGIPFYNESDDGKFIDGFAQDVIISEDSESRYIITLSCSDDFTVDDIILYAVNQSNDSYPENSKTAIKEINISDMNTHKTVPSTMHFFSSEGDYYIWNEAKDKLILPTDEGYVKVAITPESILWMSNKGSAEKLFQNILDNSKWASYMDGETYDSEYAELSLEEIDGYGLCLVKTGRTNVDEERTNPPYIAYTEPGYGTIYFSIV